MAQRDSHDDLAFGSDSFLDVVANIVGILIILIVVAGLRVSRVPIVRDAVESQTAVSSQPERAAELPIVAVSEAPAVEFPDTVWLPPAEPDPPQPLPEPDLEPIPLPRPDPTPPPELVARAAELQAQIEAARSQIVERQNRQRAIHDQMSRTVPQLTGLQNAVSAARARESELEQQARGLASTVSNSQRTLSDLQAELLTRQASGPESEVYSHRVTPLGRVVSGTELHFRLEGNRASVVPVDALADDLKNRIERNRDTLLRMQRYEGTVGPVDGYEMRYEMRQERSSVLEELRYGSGYVKMSVVFWELLPQQDVPTESAEEALHRSSRFYRTLQRAGTNATVTFWVYPDSFELHRQLQEFAHSAGFEVAARPLPVGVPIAGSPHGSRSVAQ